jgi:hypothetical protein
MRNKSPIPNALTFSNAYNFNLSKTYLYQQNGPTLSGNLQNWLVVEGKGKEVQLSLYLTN